MSDHFDVAYDCASCGKRLTGIETLADDQPVICPGCGKDCGTAGAFRKDALEHAKAALDKMSGGKIDWKKG